MTEPAIRTENLTRDFGTIRALDSVNLEIPSGIVFGFLGPNGAGKTTLLRLLLGLLEPSSGSAHVLGFDVRTQVEEIRRHTGAVLEYANLYERLTAEENLDYHGRIWQMSDADRKSRIKELLTPLGLWERRQETVAGWSRGMRQRLAVARALFHRPKLVFMDEPTSGLDPMAATALHQELLELATREGMTVFLTTHKLAEAERLCALVAVARAGKVLAVGPTSDLRNIGGVPTLEIIGSGFTDNIVALLARRREIAAIKLLNDRLLIELTTGNVHTSPLVSLLVESGADVEEVHKSKASLESIFVTMLQEEQNAVAAL